MGRHAGKTSHRDLAILDDDDGHGLEANAATQAGAGRAVETEDADGQASHRDEDDSSRLERSSEDGVNRAGFDELRQEDMKGIRQGQVLPLAFGCWCSGRMVRPGIGYPKRPLCFQALGGEDGGHRRGFPRQAWRESLPSG